MTDTCPEISGHYYRDKEGRTMWCFKLYGVDNNKHVSPSAESNGFPTILINIIWQFKICIFYKWMFEWIPTYCLSLYFVNPTDASLILRTGMIIPRVQIGS